MIALLLFILRFVHYLVRNFLRLLFHEWLTSCKFRWKVFSWIIYVNNYVRLEAGRIAGSQLRSGRISHWQSPKHPESQRFQEQRKCYVSKMSLWICDSLSTDLVYHCYVMHYGCYYSHPVITFHCFQHVLIMFKKTQILGFSNPARSHRDTAPLPVILVFRTFSFVKTLNVLGL